ncbi:MAG: ABC transporter ATP-binding protein [Micrococcaceae bacterium]
MHPPLNPPHADPRSTDSRPESPLTGRDLTVTYEAHQVFAHLDVEIPAERITCIIGPNACGKSTLLRALSRLVKPQSGEVVLLGKDIHRYTTKQVAQRLGLLPQSSTAPFGITVGDLVARGRFPYQQALQQWSQEDERIVNQALAEARVDHLSGRTVDELSGGQRQRVWMALVLAQQTPLMLLDEPTTYLDISHQLELLELCRDLNRQRGRTLVLVLHDLNQACRFADHLIVMKDGGIVTQGAPAEVMTEQLLMDVYGLEALVQTDPVFNTPLILPIASIQRRLD